MNHGDLEQSLGKASHMVPFPYCITCFDYKLCFFYLGIEPWTFVQKQGDAVYIPAGCPNQVRNIKVT